MAHCEIDNAPGPNDAAPDASEKIGKHHCTGTQCEKNFKAIQTRIQYLGGIVIFVVAAVIISLIPGGRGT